MPCYDNMYSDTTLNNLHTSGVSSLPVFSLSGSGSRAVPQAGSLMYNLDDSLVYLSQGPAIGWVPAGATSAAIHVTDTTQSTSCDTGSITTLGGFGIEKNLYVCGTLAVAEGSTLNGQAEIQDSTASTSPTTGALVVAGGVGIGSNLNVVGPVRATQLATTGMAVAVGGASPPTLGEVLTAISATTASWQFINAASLTGILPVANGGTGVDTLTPGTVLVGNGTSPVLTTMAAPVGDFVGTTDTQNITNKVITSSSDTVRATQLGTYTAGPGPDVVVSGAAPPSVGQTLVATGSGTTANWQFSGPTGAVTQLATSGSPVNVNLSIPPSFGYTLVTEDPTDALWTSLSGTYNPIFVFSLSDTNINGSYPYGGSSPSWMYYRTGNIVSVMGMLYIIQTNPAVGDYFYITIPIPRLTPFGAVYQAAGFTYPAGQMYLSNLACEYGSLVNSPTTVNSNPNTTYIMLTIGTLTTQSVPLTGFHTISFTYSLI